MSVTRNLWPASTFTFADELGAHDVTLYFEVLAAYFLKVNTAE